jgi:hypothetical protein
MSNKELAQTLRTAAESQDSIALKMLLIMAAERLESTEEVK